MKHIFLGLAVFAASCGSKPVPAPTGVSDPATTPHPVVEGAANLALSCSSAHPTCESPAFQMAVLGDVVACETQAGGSIRLQLKSSNDANDMLVVAFDGYHGPDTYSLDTPNSRFISVDDHVNLPQCTGGPINVGKRVTAADPNCGSPACTVQVGDAAPAAAFPKSLTFTVHCTSLCQNGSDVVCPGPIDFTTRADCT